MNTTVSATGMQVKAKVSGSLYISPAVDGDTSTDGIQAAAPADAALITLSETPSIYASTLHNLKPTSTTTTNKWWAAAAAVPTAYGKTGSYSDVTGNSQNYVYSETFYIRGESDFQDLVVQGITITDATSDGAITNALTVAVKTNTTTVFFSNEAPTSNRHGGVDDDGLLQSLTFTQMSSTGLTNVIKSGTTSANTIVPVTIFIYYDGESYNCYTNAANGVGVDGLSVAVTFGATFS